MSTITKQWLQQKIAEMEEHRDLFPGDLDDNHGNVLAALRIALASLEAEAVAYSLIFRNMDGVLNDYVNANTTFSTIEKAQAYGRGGNYVEQNDGSLQWVSDPSLDPVVVPLYTAPPAPVSVPDAYVRDERGRMMLNGRQEPRIGYGAGWNGYRAAMLQGAENAESRCTIQTATALDSSPKNAESRCSNSPVIADGWVLVPVEPTAEMISSGIAVHYERSQIQIHDRPAPGPMECAYVAMLAAAPQQEVK